MAVGSKNIIEYRADRNELGRGRNRSRQPGGFAGEAQGGTHQVGVDAAVA